MAMPELKEFSLVGGTALSLLYGHRMSIDLDLFCTEPFEYSIVVGALKTKFTDQFIMEARPERFGICRNNGNHLVFFAPIWGAVESRMIDQFASF